MAKHRRIIKAIRFVFVTSGFVNFEFCRHFVSNTWEDAEFRKLEVEHLLKKVCDDLKQSCSNRPRRVSG